MSTQYERLCLGPKLEIREFKRDGYAGGLKGYAVVYGTESRDMGGWREIIVRGAMSASLAKGLDVRMLYQHDQKQVIARESAGNLRLKEDQEGVYFEADLIDTQRNRDIMADVQARNLDAMSFGMPPSSIETRWERSKDGKYAIRNVLKAEMAEVSIVTWAAYEDTTVAKRDYDNFLLEQAGEQATSLRLLRDRVELRKRIHR